MSHPLFLFIRMIPFLSIPSKGEKLYFAFPAFTVAEAVMERTRHFDSGTMGKYTKGCSQIFLVTADCDLSNLNTLKVRFSHLQMETMTSITLSCCEHDEKAWHSAGYFKNIFSSF